MLLRMRPWISATDRRGGAAGAHQPWHVGAPSRRLRLASGLVLFIYVATHLIDHALCNISTAAADAMLLVQKFVWQGVAGTVLLYAALLCHVLLGLQALWARRHFRWSRAEALQLALGLAIPAMLANHLAVTRAALSLYGLDKGYVAELASLWVTAWPMGALQIAVLIAAWTHACLGLFFLLRMRRWFASWRPILLTSAVLLPVLALLGFAQGGREVARALQTPGFRAAHLGPAVVGTAGQAAALTALRDAFLALYAAAVLLVLLARGMRRVLELRRGLITIVYPGFLRVRISPGHSVLDASLLNRIPHASVCGGKGRCSTCRVRIVSTHAPLPPPAAHERQLLARIGVDPAEVRLACQLRPTADLHVVPLIPPALAFEFVAGRVPRVPEEERFVAAMFIDLRNSTGLAEQHAPFDSVFLLGRFIAAVSRAVTACGGRPVQFLGDGVLALFGLETDEAEGCRQALAAIGAIDADMADVRLLFEQQTGQALRFGIGLHCGRAIVGEISLSENIVFTALGETVNIAHRLQELARDLGATAAVSDAIFHAAGAAPPHATRHEAALRGHSAPLGVWTMDAMPMLERTA
jgi:adenylate cyclase